MYVGLLSSCLKYIRMCIFFLSFYWFTALYTQIATDCNCWPKFLNYAARNQTGVRTAAWTANISCNAMQHDRDADLKVCHAEDVLIVTWSG